MRGNYAGATPLTPLTTGRFIKKIIAGFGFPDSTIFSGCCFSLEILRKEVCSSRFFAQHLLSNARPIACFHEQTRLVLLYGKARTCAGCLAQKNSTAGAVSHVDVPMEPSKRIVLPPGQIYCGPGTLEFFESIPIFPDLSSASASVQSIILLVSCFFWNGDCPTSCKTQSFFVQSCGYKTFAPIRYTPG